MSLSSMDAHARRGDGHGRGGRDRDRDRDCYYDRYDYCNDRYDDCDRGRRGRGRGCW
ncbi:MAG TPA: hypothetical protein VK970_10215 [Candidatus Methylacidiphilales bacterium]|nr:hypothetical protein [Candidatus Methylacidiphilales bacterium]